MIVLLALIVEMDVLHEFFTTTDLTSGQWLACAAIGSTVLWVGELVKIGVERGRKTRPDLKVGICGEHGGDPASDAFCHETKLDYVSCSPFRVPIARLAAAQAALNKPAASQA